ncbi:hypothetical protein C8J57DRAFT_1210212 [Mycena rebaudengoi]|nr:hypothetical protein C8J57DRAFT_1210212 [Mycena rebaudengoi]
MFKSSNILTWLHNVLLAQLRYLIPSIYPVTVYDSISLMGPHGCANLQRGFREIMLGPGIIPVSPGKITFQTSEMRPEVAFLALNLIWIGVLACGAGCLESIQGYLNPSAEYARAMRKSGEMLAAAASIKYIQILLLYVTQCILGDSVAYLFGPSSFGCCSTHSGTAKYHTTFPALVIEKGASEGVFWSSLTLHLERKVVDIAAVASDVAVISQGTDWSTKAMSGSVDDVSPKKLA